jgi:SlyX protein
MSQDLILSDLETRIAFLEDQIDTLNHEIVFLNRDREKLTKELQALANLVRPLIDQMSQLDVADDSNPPPHF